MSTPDSYRSAEFIAGLARERRLSQLQEIDALDAKAGAMIGFTAIVLGLLFTSDLASQRWSWLLTLAAISLMSALVALLVAHWPREYLFNPNIGALARSALNRPVTVTAAVTIASIERAILHNQDVLNGKARALRVGTALLACGVLIAAGQLIYSVEHDPFNGHEKNVSTTATRA